MVAQLAEQAFAQIAAAYTWWIELANDFEGFFEIHSGEGGLINRLRRFGRGLGCRGRGGRGISVARAKGDF